MHRSGHDKKQRRTNRLTLSMKDFEVEEVKEEFEAEKERKARRPRVRVVNDYGEFTENRAGALASPHLSRRDAYERYHSVEGRLPRVEEEMKEDETRRISTRMSSKMFMEDKDEFNRPEKRKFFLPEMNLRKVSSFASDMEKINEDLATESREEGKKKHSLRTPTNKSATFTKHIRIDEVESERKSVNFVNQEEEDTQKVMQEVIEEDGEKENSNIEERLSNTAANHKQKEFFSRIIKGEKMGTWDRVATEYIVREIARTTSLPIPEYENNQERIEDKDSEDESPRGRQKAQH
eukprot:TRINITY_DN2119_c0_g1_i4.p1 TRINITY_DN2119_c0_g1~~TRINITY_DN2119_c0_g1_i4.p1  ORF type:complete len:293 (-),score=96.48 TRINITY_DN2119_c0_g1_i4:145-1023(-)